MYWTVNYDSSKALPAVDGFLLALGKAVHIAASFEAKCQYLLHVCRVQAHIEQNLELAEAIAAVNALEPTTLGKALWEFRKAIDATAEQFQTLRSAREARNYICHDAGNLGDFGSASLARLATHTEKLRAAVAALAQGDNIVSAWCYALCEREDAPRGIQADYVKMVTTWVFGSES